MARLTRPGFSGKKGAGPGRPKGPVRERVEVRLEKPIARTIAVLSREEGIPASAWIARALKRAVEKATK